MLFQSGVNDGVDINDLAMKPETGLLEDMGGTLRYGITTSSPYTVLTTPVEPEKFNEAAGLSSGYVLPEQYTQPSRVFNEQEWQGSIYGQAGIPFQEGINESYAEALLETQQERERYANMVSRAPDSFGRDLLRMGVFMGSQIVDPLLFMPYVGWSAKAVNTARAASGLGRVARLDKIASTADRSYRQAVLTGSADAVVGGAISRTITYPRQIDSGADITFHDIALETLLDGTLGGIFGSVANALHRRGARLDQVSSEAADAHQQAIRTAAAQHMEGDPVDVKPVMDSVLARQTEDITRAYDRVLNDPQGGPHDEVMAVISSPEFEKILVERGPSILNEDGSLTVHGKQIAQMFPGSRGAGLVKIIWRHGEKSKTKEALKVTRDDITSIPKIINEYSPVQNAGRRQGRNETRWSVPVDENLDLVVSVSKTRRYAKDDTLITVFRHDKGEYGKSAKRMDSSDLPGERPASLRPDNRQPSPGDTTGGSRIPTPRSQEALNSTITRQGELFKPLEEIDFNTTSRTARAGEAEAGLSMTDDLLDSSWDMERLNQAMRDIEEWEANGLLLDSERAQLEEARQIKIETEDDAAGMLDMLNCILGG